MAAKKPRKAWQNYAAVWVAAMLNAEREPFPLTFQTHAKAKATQATLQQMQSRIRQDHEAPDELRAAAVVVAWSMPKQTDAGWTIIGARRKQMGVPIEEIEREIAKSLERA